MDLPRCKKGTHRDKKTKDCLPTRTKSQKNIAVKPTSSSHKTKTGRCRKGFYKNKRTDECLLKALKKKRCPKGSRKNKEGTLCIGKNNEVFPSYSSMGKEVEDDIDDADESYSADFEDESPPSIHPPSIHHISSSHHVSPKKKSSSHNLSAMLVKHKNVMNEIKKLKKSTPKKKSSSHHVSSSHHISPKKKSSVLMKRRKVMSDIKKLKKSSHKSRSTRKRSSLYNKKDSKFEQGYSDLMNALNNPIPTKKAASFSKKQRQAQPFLKNVNIYKNRLRKTKKSPPKENYSKKSTGSLLNWVKKNSTEKRQDKLRNKKEKELEKMKNERVYLNSDEKHHINLMYGIKEDKTKKKTPRNAEIKKSPPKKVQNKKDEEKAAAADKEREVRDKARLDRQAQIKKEEDEKEEENRKRKLKEDEEKAAAKKSPVINVKDRMKMFEKKNPTAAKPNFIIAKKK